MPLSPESDRYISTDDEGPFTLERYRARLKRKSAANHSNQPIDRGSPVKEAFPIGPVPYLSAQMIHLPPPPIKQIFIRKPMTVGGRGLTALAEIASKAETTREEVIKETQSSSSAKMAKCMTSGENRRFIDALYELEDVIASTAEEVDTNEIIFQNIEPRRIRASWKMAGRALQDLALALSRMTKEHSTEKNVRICRKYVVRVLTRIAFHHGVGQRGSRVTWMFANES